VSFKIKREELRWRVKNKGNIKFLDENSEFYASGSFKKSAIPKQADNFIIQMGW
jgi:hypothetical protein